MGACNIAAGITVSEDLPKKLREHIDGSSVIGVTTAELNTGRGCTRIGPHGSSLTCSHSAASKGSQQLSKRIVGLWLPMISCPAGSSATGLDTGRMCLLRLQLPCKPFVCQQVCL
mmetsp:Transcript_12827/g.35502  ORF Transcript_12827/g.35502 Transcript_12827/m.35502 type:complete len:115 (+) Transcript_12827:449-793(+)